MGVALGARLAQGPCNAADRDMGAALQGAGKRLCSLTCDTLSAVGIEDLLDYCTPLCLDLVDFVAECSRGMIEIVERAVQDKSRFI